MGNIATYQVKILFNSQTEQAEWLKQHNIFDTLCLLRSEQSTHSYNVPFYIDDSRFEFQFGEKWSLFEGYENSEYGNSIRDRIWNADKNNLIKKIYYRSSDGLDKIFSVANKSESKHRYCRYGFDCIKFKMNEGTNPSENEVEILNIKNNSINLNGSYQTENCRTRILGIKSIGKESYGDIKEYYKTITGLCTLNWEPPTNIFPLKLRDNLKLFFRACETIEFYWKGRRTLKMTNQSTDKYPDSYKVESDDYWDNVVDIDFFADTNTEQNIWNNKEISKQDEILSVTQDDHSIG
jgi:hypothetical protein